MKYHGIAFNEKQESFIHEFSATIEFAMLEGQFLRTWRVLEKLEEYQQYQQSFSKHSKWQFMDRYFSVRSPAKLEQYHRINHQLCELFQSQSINPLMWEVKEPEADDVFNGLQLTFLNHYSEAIVFGVIANKFLNNGSVIDMLLAWDAYKVLLHPFNNWDNILDYFEDSSVYKRIYHRALHEQFRKISTWLPE